MITANRPTHPTLYDVATAAGVSVKTASRTINGEPGVRPETAERVMKAAKELGFRRNELARSLRASTRSTTVGVVIGDVGDPFWSGVLRGVEEALGDRDAVIMSASTKDDARLEQKVVRSMIERRVMALLLVPTAASQSYLRAELQRGTVMVCVDRPARGLKVDAVVADDRGGARRGVAHLVEHGHRRIAYIGAKNVYTMSERLAGYRDALAEGGIDIDEELVRQGASTPDLAEEATRQLMQLPDPPTAVFAANIPPTFGVLRAMHVGRRRLALVGFSDFDAADVVEPGVTVVRNDPVTLGRTAMELAWERLDGNDKPPRIVRIETTLVPRGSGEVTP